jgi:DNA-binding HxlR family transcriptional regulator
VDGGDWRPETLSGFCPRYHQAIEIIGRRWTGVIVRALLTGDTRFSQIRSTIPGLSDRLLSERLKELEAEGIVERRVLAETPVRIEYHLTAKGRALADVVQAASAWAERWLPPEPASTTPASAEAATSAAPPTEPASATP